MRTFICEKKKGWAPRRLVCHTKETKSLGGKFDKEFDGFFDILYIYIYITFSPSCCRIPHRRRRRKVKKSFPKKEEDEKSLRVLLFLLLPPPLLSFLQRASLVSPQDGERVLKRRRCKSRDVSIPPLPTFIMHLLN